MIYKSLSRKLKRFSNTNTTKKTSVISGFLKWKAVPAPPVAKTIFSTRLNHRNVGPVQIRHHHHLIKKQINLAI